MVPEAQNIVASSVRMEHVGELNRLLRGSYWQTIVVGQET